MNDIKSKLKMAFGVLIALFIIFAICDLVAYFTSLNLANYVLSPLSPFLGARKTNAANNSTPSTTTGS